IRTAPPGIATLSLGPTLAIRPSTATTVCSGSTPSWSIGIVFTPTIAMVEGVAECTGDGIVQFWEQLCGIVTEEHARTTSSRMVSTAESPKLHFVFAEGPKM